MVSTKDMTDADMVRADQIIENAFELMRDIIANPSAMAAVPSPSTIDVIPLADVTDNDEIVATTERFAIKLIALRDDDASNQ